MLNIRFGAGSANMSQQPALQTPGDDQESTRSASSRRVDRRCVVCTDRLAKNMPTLGCGHSWCSSCLVRVFSSVKNQRNWPVKCLERCNVPFSAVEPYLDKEERQRLAPLIEELESPVIGRVYCSNAPCSAYIPPSLRPHPLNATVVCEKCDTETCVTCKTRAHPNQNCPPTDADEQQTLLLSSQRKWKRCTQCGQICERTQGCRHMKCFCGYDFCYNCGGPIRDCNGCPYVPDPDQIMARLHLGGYFEPFAPMEPQQNEDAMDQPAMDRLAELAEHVREHPHLRQRVQDAARDLHEQLTANLDARRTQLARHRESRRERSAARAEAARREAERVETERREAEEEERMREEATRQLEQQLEAARARAEETFGTENALMIRRLIRAEQIRARRAVQRRVRHWRDLFNPSESTD